MHLFLSAGEPSGDLHASNLARELFQQNPESRIVGYGGERMAAAGAQLKLDPTQFLHLLPAVVEPVNLWLGWAKSVLFGGTIALLACHFGLRVKPNTESLGQSVTQSVVTAITLVIVVDAIFAVLFSNVGI